MDGIGKSLSAALVSLTFGLSACVAPVHAQNRFSILKTIAMDIENLNTDFPQLRNFSAATHLHAEPPSISYAFHMSADGRRH